MGDKLYKLKSRLGTRGFYVEKAGRQIFKTTHKFGFMRASSVTIGGENIAITSKNLMGSLFSIRKNGDEVGNIDLTSYLFSQISLQRYDGTVDRFKFEEEGFSSTFILSHAGVKLMKFTASMNPVRVNELYDVDVLSETFPTTAIEELMFYAGEIIFRQISSSVSRRM